MLVSNWQGRQGQCTVALFRLHRSSAGLPRTGWGIIKPWWGLQRRDACGSRSGCICVQVVQVGGALCSTPPTGSERPDAGGHELQGATEGAVFVRAEAHKSWASCLCVI